MTTYQQTLAAYGSKAKTLIRPLLVIVAIMWTLEICDRLIFGGSLDNLGIIPRQFAGLRGVVLSPLLHFDFSHLIANTVPFLVLGLMLMLRHRANFLTITAIITLASGLGTWLLAPTNTVTIGASGLVFGYFAFLVINAWYERSSGAILFALLVIGAYGGLIWGIFPTGNGISWQSHFFGLIGGVAAAHLLNRHGDQ